MNFLKVINNLKTFPFVLKAVYMILWTYTCFRMTERDTTQSMTSNAVEKFHKESFGKDSTNKNTYVGSHWSCFGKFFGGRKAI